MITPDEVTTARVVYVVHRSNGLGLAQSELRAIPHTDELRRDFTPWVFSSATPLAYTHRRNTYTPERSTLVTVRLPYGCGDEEVPARDVFLNEADAQEYARKLNEDLANQLRDVLLDVRAIRGCIPVRNDDE